MLKIYRYKVDNLLKIIKQLKQEHYALQQQIYDLGRRKDQEINNYQHSEYIFLLPSYLQAYKMERDRCTARLNSLTQELAEQEHQLAQHYAETKKVEIVLDQRILHAAQHEQQQQYKVQDDIYNMRTDLEGQAKY